MASSNGQPSHLAVELINEYPCDLETAMSIRPAKVHAQPSTDASNRSGSGIKTKKSQRPSRDDRMLWGAGILLRKVYVEATGAQENAPKAITIQNYESLASYSWKDTEHPTIYVPGTSLPLRLQGV